MPKLRYRKRSTVKGTLQQPKSQVTVKYWHSGAEEFEDLPPEQISEILPQPGVLVWVDIRDPSSADLEMLTQEFGFNELSLEDVVKERQRPKVDEYPNYYFVVLYAPLPASRSREVQTAEVDLFVGKNYLVSIHPGNVPALREAMMRWEITDVDQRDRIGFLTHIVVDTIIDAYFPVVNNIDDRLDMLELSMFKGNSSANPEELLALKRSLFTLRKAIYPLREAFELFPRRDHSLFDLDTHPYFQDVYDHILRLLDLVEIQRDMITDALDAHLAFVSNNLNETMKTLTVLGICVAIAGAVFGAWGMNVRNIPLADARFHGVQIGFWLVSGLTLILIGIALAWTHKRGMW